MHSHAACQWRIDIHRFPCDPFALFCAKVADGSHVVQPIGQLDQDDPEVLGHGQHHLAQVLGLGLGLVLEVDLGEFGDAVNAAGDVVAELFPQVFHRDIGILDDVVEKTCLQTD